MLTASESRAINMRDYKLLWRKRSIAPGGIACGFSIASSLGAPTTPAAGAIAHCRFDRSAPVAKLRGDKRDEQQICSPGYLPRHVDVGSVRIPSAAPAACACWDRYGHAGSGHKRNGPAALKNRLPP